MPAALGGRHAEIGVVGRDPGEQLALLGLTRYDDRRAFGRSKQAVALIEPEVGLALVDIRAVALIARFREDRADLPVEVDACQSSSAART